MAFTYTVQLNDPYGLSQDNAVIAAMQAAAAAPTGQPAAHR